MKHILITIIAIVALVGCGGAEERKAAYLEKARLSMEVGNLDKARIELKNVLQIDPKEAQAYFQLGDIYDLKKNYRKAFGNYLKAEELDPDNLEYHARIGTYFLIMAGDIDKAAEKRDLVLGKDKDNISGLLLKAGILLKQNDAVGAKKISQDIFSRQPGHIANATFLSSLYLRRKEYDQSINVITACIKENPEKRSLASLLANTYFKAGKNELAENEYQKILEKNPEVFSNYFILASFYKEIGNNDKAENVLRNAIEMDADDLRRKMVLVEFIQQTRGNQSAIEELKSLIANNKNIGELRLSLARLYADEKNQDEAVKVLEATVSDFSEDSVGIKSRVYLANMYMQYENIDAAKNIIDDAIKISPNDSDVNLVNAKIQVVNKNYEGAVISLRTVIKEDPENISAYFLLSATHRANGEEQQASEIINRAYENNRTNANSLQALSEYYVKNKNIQKLEKVIDSLLAIKPHSYEALSHKSALLNKRKMFSEAKPHALRILKLYPDMPNGYIQSVPYMMAENRTSEAASLLEEGYKKVNKKDRILELLVTLYASLKDFDSAINKVQSAIREKGETAELYMLLAKIQLTSKKIENAKKSLLKSSSIKADWNEPYLMLANIYMTDKQNKKAITVLQNGLVKIESDLKLSLSLARLYESLGNFNAAISEYEKAYEQHTDNVIITNNLASLLSEYRNDEASLKRAKELADKLKNVDQAVILDTAGWVYYKTGDYAEAVNILKTVVEKLPDVAVFNYHLGMALYKSGDEAAAKKHLTSALATKGSFPGKDDAKVHLQKLK